MFPPNIDPQLYALSATLVGAVISPDFTPNEANTVGNWLVLVGDYLLAYAGQQALIEGRMQNTTNNTNSSNQAQMDAIMKALQKMQNEIENLKKQC